MSAAVTASPVNTTVPAGQMATFTASANGLPVPTVQWQVSTDGGANYLPLTNDGQYFGVNTTTLSIINTTTSMNGYQYAAVFTNGVSPTPTAGTNAATLTVNSVLSITPAAPARVRSPRPLQSNAVGCRQHRAVHAVLRQQLQRRRHRPLARQHHHQHHQRHIHHQRHADRRRHRDLHRRRCRHRRRQPDADADHHDQAAPQHRHHDIAEGDGRGDLQSDDQRCRRRDAVRHLRGDQLQRRHHGPDPRPNHRRMPRPAPSRPPARRRRAARRRSPSTSPIWPASPSVTKNYTITVNPALAITPSLPQGTAGTNYHQTLTVTGGGTPYTSFTITGFNAGTTGLTISSITTNTSAGTITINGTPTGGTFTFTANVVDALGATLTKTYTVTINPALTITPSLPQGTAGVSYLHTITLTGGSTPYTTFSVTGFSAGSTGLSAAAVTVNASNNTVVVSGTPTTAGTLAFTVNVADTAGSTLTKAFSITVNPAPTVSNLTTTQWTAGVPGFTGKMTISGGTSPHTITGATGLPMGLTAVVNGNTISFTGTPMMAGTFANGSVTIHDAAGATVTKTFSITINAAPSISTLTATQWTTGRAGFNGVMTTAGGTGGLSIGSSTGVPTGLSISLTGNTLSFTGTPTAVGTFAGSVTLTDAIGAKVTRTFSITINAVPTIGNLTTTQWTAGYAGFTGLMTISSGTGPFTLVSASGIPTGLTAVVSGNTIRFTGTPSVAQAFGSGSITIARCRRRQRHEDLQHHDQSAPRDHDHRLARGENGVSLFRSRPAHRRHWRNHLHARRRQPAARHADQQHRRHLRRIAWLRRIHVHDHRDRCGRREDQQAVYVVVVVYVITRSLAVSRPSRNPIATGFPVRRETASDWEAERIDVTVRSANCCGSLPLRIAHYGEPRDHCRPERRR